MCGTSQRQYGLGQKQGKTLVISRLPSGGTGRYAARRRQAEKQRLGRPRMNRHLHRAACVGILELEPVEVGAGRESAPAPRRQRSLDRPGGLNFWLIVT